MDRDQQAITAFEALARLALSLPHNQADPIGVFDTLVDAGLFKEHGLRPKLIEVWRQRKAEYPWFFPFN